MQEKPEKNLLLYNALYTMFKRKRLIIVLSVATFLLVILGTWIEVPTWDATSLILVRNRYQQRPLFDELTIPLQDSPRVNQAANLIQILYSRNMAEEVVRKFKLDERLEKIQNNPSQLEYNRLRYHVKNAISGVVSAPIGLLRGLFGGGDKEVNYFDRAVQQFMQGAEKIELAQATQVISLTIVEQEPVLASNISNFMAQRLVERSANMDQGYSRSALAFLEERFKAAEEELKQAERNLLEYSQKENIISVTAEKASKMEQYSVIEDDLTTVTSNLAEGRAKLQGLTDQITRQRGLLSPTALETTSPSVAALLDRLNTLESNLAGARAKLDGLQAQVVQQRGLLSPTMVVSDNPTIAALKHTLNDLEANLAAAKANFAPGSLTIKKLEAQIEQNKQQLGLEMEEILKNQLSVLDTIHNSLPQEFVNTMVLIASLEAQIGVTKTTLEKEMGEIVGNDYAVLDTIHRSLTQDYVDTTVKVMSLEARQAILKEQLAAIRAEAQALVEKGMSIDRLERDIATKKELYSNFLEKISQLKAQSAAETSGFDLQVIDPANLPLDAKKDSPSWPLNLALGLIASLLLGVGGAFFAEYWVENFRSPRDVEERVGLPVICTLSDIPARKLSAS